jgi:perosamine synthetase
MTNGTTVAAFERAFEDYVGAKYAIALCNGTATLHTALVALGVKPGDRVAVPPLTMSATTIAVLHAGAVPVFCDVDPETWVMEGVTAATRRTSWAGRPLFPVLGVSLYGLHGDGWDLDDAAQTLRPHGGAAFTSYSFQASKILALGEGGMLVTDSEELATIAREFSSLGYRMRADQPRIDPAVLKSPTYARHYALGWNYRMNDLTAAEGLRWVARDRFGECDADVLRENRRRAAALYADAIAGCDWLTPQHVPEGWTHDYWAFAVACDTPARALALQEAVTRHGGERPYGAWRLTYQEPAFRHLAPDGTCPVAESLQPRLLQFQTNNTASAERNAAALRLAIRELGGAR